MNGTRAATLSGTALADLLPREGIHGLVAGILKHSLVDGPGNRFVTFLQGCNLDCLACHNPYTINVCDGCGVCVSACTTGSLEARDGWVLWNPDTCAGCDACTRICPSDSTPKTQQLTPRQLLEEVRPVAPFLSGVTVSGGEATMQAPFVRAYFQALRDDPGLSRLTRFVDSNGHASRATWDLLEPVMDAAMLDLKALDDDVHRALTGSSNQRVLASIDLLAARGQLYEVRLLLIAGRNDSDDQMRRTASYLARVAPGVRVKVIGFRRHGVRAAGQVLQEPTRERLEEIAAVLLEEGVDAVEIV
jgi:YjjW family glycine radical enzyme activase